MAIIGGVILSVIMGLCILVDIGHLQPDVSIATKNITRTLKIYNAPYVGIIVWVKAVMVVLTNQVYKTFRVEA